MREPVYVDMDGVIVDFDRYTNEMYENDGGFLENQHHFWNTCVIQSHCFLMMDPLIAGCNMLNWLVKDYGVQCTILTSTGGGKYHSLIARHKLEWLEKNGFGHLPVAFWTSTKNKASYAASDRILIDDRWPVIQTWEENGGRGQLFKPEDSNQLVQRIVEMVRT